ncbi:MAG: large-conductance mechanosensitive channel protein MscL [Tenericutes bacterium]|nr:large-conductance mechanosensitive channel protein MscL [Mycoplasmatota bacterium]
MKKNNKEIRKEIKTKSGKTIKEFKEFISKGNVIDLAVGVIIGGAFSKIVSSLVNDIIMPLIGIIIGGINLTNLTLKLGDATVNYGVFLQNILDFLIVALCIFIFVKIINKFNRKKETPPAPPKKDDKTILLEEIRDLLKKK